MFAALSWELALAIGRRDLATVTCTGCGQPYTPLKMPSKSQKNHYCHQCRADGVPARDRKRRQRNQKEGQPNG